MLDPLLAVLAFAMPLEDSRGAVNDRLTDDLRRLNRLEEQSPRVVGLIAWAESSLVYDLGVEEVATDRLTGCVGIQRGLHYLSPSQVNLTHAAYPAWRGRGFATRAVRLSMEVARRRGTVTPGSTVRSRLRWPGWPVVST